MKIYLSILFWLTVLTGRTQYSNFPVTLSLPYDTDTITNVHPVFVWQCNLAAVQNDPRLSLRFALAEKTSGQTTAEAISTNLPICVAEGLLATSYSYPSTLQELQPGHTYAWQVQLLFNEQVVQESEPWQFTIADPQPVNHQYIALNIVQDGSFHIFTGREAWLLLKDEYDLSAPNARIRKPDGEMIDIQLSKVIADGQEDDGGLFNENNLYYLYCDLGSVPEMQGIYTLSVISKQNKTYFLNFTLE